jgi:tRNA/tmRNA/rRNA uracil-C5-methylase (TrmA/RlmC/RlmD family)
VADALRPAPGDTVLDLYCGAGLFAGVLAEAVGPDGTVIGIEADTGAVRDARHNLRPTLGPGAQGRRRGDARKVRGVRREPGRARPAPTGLDRR